MLMLGNLLRESGVVERLTKTAQNELMNIVTIFLGVTVGATATARELPRPRDASRSSCWASSPSAFGTAGGVLLGKLMCNLLPRARSTRSSALRAFPPCRWRRASPRRSARRRTRGNFLLMHAMGPNVAGVIGSAVAAGVFLALFG